MFGIRFIKIQPTTYVLQYKAGEENLAVAEFHSRRLWRRVCFR